MFKIKRHLVNLIILFFLWTTASFNLNMISFYMKYVSRNLFLLTLTTSLGDIPLSMLGGFAYHKLGPRRSIPIFLAVALFGSISLSTWAAPEKGLPVALVSFIVLLTFSGIKSVFDSCYLATSNTFPAIFSGTAFGFCNFGARVCSIFSAPMAEVKPPIPMIIFAFLCACAMILSCMLREQPKEEKEEKDKVPKS
jgi:hypothetical protein